jgi:hypothetical protein
MQGLHWKDNIVSPNNKYTQNEIVKKQKTNKVIVSVQRVKNVQSVE